jgi:hypothetical protein
VLAITDHSDQRLALAVERFGRTKPGRLGIYSHGIQAKASAIYLAKSFAPVLGILAEPFPMNPSSLLTSAPDLEHSLSGNYVRGLLRHGSSHVAVLAVPDGESADTAESSLTFGLLWLHRSRNSFRTAPVIALRLILPKEAPWVFSRCSETRISARTL